MKKMKSLIIVAITIMYCNSVNAQIVSIPVAKIQILLDKAIGQKYVNLLGNDEKITKQVLSESTYSLFVTSKKDKWVTEYSNIQWGDGFTHYITDAPGNDKLKICEFKFKRKTINFNKHGEGESGNDRDFNSFEFYILAKDSDEMQRLIK